MPSISEMLSEALRHHRAGRLQEAEALYRQILQSKPDHPDALHLLGLIAHHAGRHDAAVDLIGKAIAINPAAAEFHNAIGAAYRALGRLEEAIAHYRQAVGLNPAYGEAHYNLGNALKEQGKLEEAVDQYRRALAVAPNNGEAHGNLAGALRDLHRLEEAVAHYRLALALSPNSAQTHYNLGTALQEQGKLEEAVACLRQAVALKPEDVAAHNNLGGALWGLGRLEEAVACYRQALALQPASAEMHFNLGVVLVDQGRGEDAVAHFRQALRLNPDYAEAENQLMHELQHLCEWGQLEELIERHRHRIRHNPSSIIVPFTMLSVTSSQAEQLTSAGNWVANRLSGVRSMRERLGFRFARASKPRLRLGYLSADFHEHATAYLITELFELHDRARFEVCVYSYGPDDGGTMRRRIVRACDRFTDVTADSVEDAARRIYDDGIDILLDLKGYTRSARPRIVALRPAPIQVNYLGYPGTMGADFMDYIITDRFVTPLDQEPHFTEKLVYLPDCYQINDRQRRIADCVPSRTECGLPEQGVVFCCLSNSFKITPAVFAVWMRVLQAAPGSVLWLLEANHAVVANLRREADGRGIAPDRLIFAPRVPMMEHLARLRVADLFLDTLPYNAHTTASDALWAGLPVLTCVGETFASRVAGSLLMAIGLPELITRSLSEYEAAALRLARDPSKLAGLRRRLAQNRLTTPLFDSARYTRHLERAYQMMWETYLKGEAPRRIEVPAMRPL